MVSNWQTITGYQQPQIGKSVTVSALISVNEQCPIMLDIREKNNSQWDFLQIVVYAIDRGYLKPGDFFILDNAPIHGGEESWEILDELLEAKGINLVFLPKYSPELNPVELLWRYLKQTLRNLGDIKDLQTLEYAVPDVVVKVKLETILGWYWDCFEVWKK